MKEIKLKIEFGEDIEKGIKVFFEALTENIKNNKKIEKRREAPEIIA